MDRFGKHLLELGGINALITCFWAGSVNTCWSWVATTGLLLVSGQVRVGAQDYDYAMSILHNDYRVN